MCNFKLHHFHFKNALRFAFLFMCELHRLWEYGFLFSIQSKRREREREMHCKWININGTVPSFFLNVRKHFATHLFAITNYVLGLIGQDAYHSHHTRAHIKSNKCANVHIISLHENMLQGIKKRMKLSLTWPPFNIHMWVI